MIRDIFIYVDSVFIPSDKMLLPTFDMGLALFREVVLGDSSIESRLGQALTEELAKDSSGELSIASSQNVTTTLSLLTRFQLDFNRF